MSNFLLKDPDCVLIHIPKNGGSTIRRGLWNANYVGPEFGAIPDDWAGYFKFAFVRHPLDRLISAWRDFSQYRKFEGGIEKFLDIVEDESIIYDERRKTMEESLRHHTIPQTHPFNCLSAADFVGRYETYLADLNQVLARVGKTADVIPAIRKTDRQPWTAYLKGEALARAVEFYDDDFAALGYEKP